MHYKLRNLVGKKVINIKSKNRLDEGFIMTFDDQTTLEVSWNHAEGFWIVEEEKILEEYYE